MLASRPRSGADRSVLTARLEALQGAGFTGDAPGGQPLEHRALLRLGAAAS
jgi:hypothetical protein